MKKLKGFLPGISIVFALVALFMIFAPSVTTAEGLVFTGLHTAFGYTEGVFQYFTVSANIATYLLIIIGIIASLIGGTNANGKFSTIIAMLAYLVSAILFLSAVTLSCPQIGFDLKYEIWEIEFTKKSLHLGAGAITGLVFSLLAALTTAALLLSEKSEKIFTTKWITYTAIMTALVVATGFIPPIPTVAGRIYWVDGMVLIAAFLLDPLAAFIAGGVGSLLYDVLMSPSMMLASLLIHGLQGVVVSSLMTFVFPKRFKKWEWVKAIIFSLAGAIVVVLGYFIYRCITLGVPMAVTNIPRNVIQEVIGISIAVVLCYATTFKKQLEKQHLLPDFRVEVLNKGEKVEAVNTENVDTETQSIDENTEN